jgi:hypothetical protein
MNGRPASGIAIQLAPGANALTTADAVKAKAISLAASFPPGVKLAFPVDNTTFIRLSINDVIKTLVEATFLVVVVMFIFLQHWRTTLIPAIAVPVVLLGTFAVLAAAGYSINTLTMFALVLAIGLLVDDAIVVVENVERLMREEGLSPRDATRKSMDEITGALIGIALVLSAVFLPMAFFGGSTGVIYRQFSVTIVSAMVLSIMVALILTPALCATLLKPIPKGGAELHGRFFTWFNQTFEYGMNRYRSALLHPPADGVSSRGGPRRHIHAIHPAGRRHAIAHPRRRRAGRAPFHGGRASQCRHGVRRHRLQLRRLRPECGPGLRPSEELERPLRLGEPRAGDRAARHEGVFAHPRRPGVRAGAACRARVGQFLRLRRRDGGSRRPWP